MFTIFVILIWVSIGYCAYIWDAKRNCVTYFNWNDFLFITCLGILSLLMIIIDEFIYNFPKFMEKLLKKINK